MARHRDPKQSSPKISVKWYSIEEDLVDALRSVKKRLRDGNLTANDIRGAANTIGEVLTRIEDLGYEVAEF